MGWLGRKILWLAKFLFDIADTGVPAGTNVLGLAMLLAACGPAIAITASHPSAEQGPLVILCGVISFALDAGFRKALKHESLLKSDRGARLLYCPLWMWGLLWILVGAIQGLRSLLA